MHQCFHFFYRSCPLFLPSEYEGGGQLDLRRVKGILNPCATSAKKEQRTGNASGVFCQRCIGLWAPGCWLACRLRQLKASTAIDIGISNFIISA